MQSKLDSFQRRIIRIFVLNVRWPNIVKNEEMFTKKKKEPWSIIIGKRRLKWFAKIAPTDPSTPRSLCFIPCFRRIQKTQRKTTEDILSIMKQQLRSEFNMSQNKAFDKAKVKNVWKTLINDCPI